MGVQEQEHLWGGETTKAVDNFPVSGETVPVPVVHWLARIKGASARVNAELGLLDADRAKKIAEAADQVANGASTTSSRSTCSRRVRDLDEHERQRGDREPRRQGRASQRRRQHGPVVKRRVPSAVHLAALDTATNDLLPALAQLEASFRQRPTSSTTSSSPGAPT